MSLLDENLALGAESVTILELEPRRAWKFSRPKRTNGAGAPMRCTGVGGRVVGEEMTVGDKREQIQIIDVIWNVRLVVVYDGVIDSNYGSIGLDINRS